LKRISFLLGLLLVVLAFLWGYRSSSVLSGEGPESSISTQPTAPAGTASSPDTVQPENDEGEFIDESDEELGEEDLADDEISDESEVDDADLEEEP
jgi:hypothetical protein